MRKPIITLVPLLAGLVALPAQGQVSVRLHADIPIGRPGAVYAGPRRPIIVRDYDPSLYGAWDSYYDQWLPQTLYYYDGSYYDYPIVEYAEPILAYQFRGAYFFAPRVPEFIAWQQRYHYRDYARSYGPAGGAFGRSRPVAPQRDTRQYVAPRDTRQYAAPRSVAPQRDSRQFEAPRGVQPQQRNGRDGRQAQPAPQQSGRSGASGRDGARGRPRGGH